MPRSRFPPPCCGGRRAEGSAASSPPPVGSRARGLPPREARRRRPPQRVCGGRAPAARPGWIPQRGLRVSAAAGRVSSLRVERSWRELVVSRSVRTPLFGDGCPPSPSPLLDAFPQNTAARPFLSWSLPC